jgi:putative YhdH/YhfP family quinone oxidoreductase
MPSQAFKAYLISQEEGRVVSRFVDLPVEQMDAGEVTVRVAYSSINYKDALAATGAGKIIRRFPCIGGVDFSGTVTESADPRFAPGDEVLATGYDIGVAHHGGYAELARVPADWVRKLPPRLSLKDAMALGTAGFAAGLGITRMEENGLKPSNGPVLVTGATGGVGSLAIDMLAGLGYDVTALTGKAAERDYLRGLGAKDIMLRQSLDLTKIKPLDKLLWAGVVDNLGGDVLAWAASNMRQGGTIASIGLAASMSLNTTVAPFILRGACLLGIDSGYIGEPYRSGVWQRLATDLRPRHLAAITHTIAFADLPSVFDDFIKSRIRGRIVVEIAGAS